MAGKIPESHPFLDFCRSQKFPAKISKEQRLHFTASLLEIFGNRYISQIKEKLGKEEQEVLDLIHRVYYEFQTHVSGSKSMETIVKLYLPQKQGEEFFLSVYKTRSDETLPFHQSILKRSNPDFKNLQRIETARVQAFSLLISCLVPESESKEQKGGPQKLSNDQELGLTSFYCNQVALFDGQQRIYFGDLLTLWQSFSDQNAQAAKQLFKQFTMRHWVKEPQIDIFRFSKYKDAKNFQEFLIFCSLDILEKNLNIQFSPFLREKFSKIFCDEMIRSDLCYFSLNLDSFCQMKLESFKNRSSVDCILSLQLFLSLVKTHQIDPKIHISLLEMIVSKDPKWNWSNLERCKDVHLSFGNAWDLFHKIDLLPKNLYQDPGCWEMFFFLWTTKKRDLVLEFLDKQSSMTLSQLYKKCLGHELFLTGETIEFSTTPSGRAFDVLKFSASSLGITSQEELISEIFYDAEIPPSHFLDADCEKALKIAVELQAQYKFADSEIFFLYLEIIHLIEKQDEGELAKALKFIAQEKDKKKIHLLLRDQLKKVQSLVSE